MANRRAIRKDGYGPQDSQPRPGISGGRMSDPRPTYVKADNEKVIEDNNGSSIVLGRDRPGSRISGYGHEQGSSRIDLTVGRLAAENPGSVDEEGNIVYADPSFELDAARIYISARADIDQYLGLRPGSVGMADAKSAVAIKGDAVRLVGREGIKLVTRCEAVNSQGGAIERVGGIDLIAGNDDKDLQPMVKGDNVVNAINELATWVGKLNGIIDGILLEQMQMNTALALHTHQGISPFLGLPLQTLPSIDLAPTAGKVGISLLMSSISLKSHRINGESYKMNYLKPWGRKYICSRYNNTN